MLYQVGQVARMNNTRAKSHALSVAGWAVCSILIKPDRVYYGTEADITCKNCRRYMKAGNGWELAVATEEGP